MIPSSRAVVNGGSFMLPLRLGDKNAFIIKGEQMEVQYMPTLISTPTIIKAAGNKPKIIEEFIQS
jgi:hypothetical protein